MQIFHYAEPFVDNIPHQDYIWTLGRVYSDWKSALLAFGLWSNLQNLVGHTEL